MKDKNNDTISDRIRWA